MNEKNEIHKIRPAARLISTIGEDLVGDTYAAIVELVKNAYDADANKVDIVFDYKDINTLVIEIQDDGHGMTNETVLQKWLVPATKDKLERKKSPKGRLFQGRKGIGRYAAAILGQELLLKTIDENQNETQVFIDWKLFEKKEFLDDVNIIVTTRKNSQETGTLLSITARGEKVSQWGRAELSSLTKELRKLIPPFDEYSPEEFEINLVFYNCPYEEYNDKVFELEAFPISKLFDYRIWGTISNKGKMNALYVNQYEPNLPSDKITKDIQLSEGKSYCGKIEFDFRVFDRDPEAIENLINKGLIDPISKLAVGKREAKRLLDEVYGVNLYREGFRIRPYGNGGIDWLNLDKERIQRPAFKVSNNQVLGFVNIKPEEISHLEEKSARDGLKENSYYFGLVELVRTALIELEARRYSYREKTGKGRKSSNIHKDLDILFDYDQLSYNIKRKLNFLKIDEETVDEIAAIIQKDAEKKSILLNNIQKTIAIYQGQATLGKVVTVLLHEGRKPVTYFKQQSPNLLRWLKIYKAKGKWEDSLYDKIVDRLQNIFEQSNFLSGLFRRLDPLAKQKRGNKIDFNVKDAIQKSISIFEGTLKKTEINISLHCDKKISYLGWEEDLIIAITNLLENSIYWLNSANIDDKKIMITVTNSDNLVIHYKNNGPNIDKDSIESSVIFEPGFSKKLTGTGLGLPISGEAVERLNGSIVAHHVDYGVYFTIELKG